MACIRPSFLRGLPSSERFRWYISSRDRFQTVLALGQVGFTALTKPNPKLMQAMRGEEVRARTKVSTHKRYTRRGNRSAVTHANIRQYTPISYGMIPSHRTPRSCNRQDTWYGETITSSPRLRVPSQTTEDTHIHPQDIYGDDDQNQVHQDHQQELPLEAEDG